MKRDKKRLHRHLSVLLFVLTHLSLCYRSHLHFLTFISAFVGIRANSSPPNLTVRHVEDKYPVFLSSLTFLFHNSLTDFGDSRNFLLGVFHNLQHGFLGLCGFAFDKSTCKLTCYLYFFSSPLIFTNDAMKAPPLLCLSFGFLFVMNQTSLKAD